MKNEAKKEISVESLTEDVKLILNNISVVKETTKRDDDHRAEINFLENPLNPNLLAYCFDEILGFDVRYRI